MFKVAMVTDAFVCCEVTFLCINTIILRLELFTLSLTLSVTQGFPSLILFHPSLLPALLRLRFVVL